MQVQPFFWRGRFYNNKSDFISLRLARTIKCFAGRFIREFVGKECGDNCEITPENWVEKACVIERSDELLISWIGHSTFLIQLNGFNILTDPAFYNIPFFAHRFFKAGISIELLPKIDFVIISHNHYDHLDEQSIKLIVTKHNPVFFVPRGNKIWFEKRSIFNVVEKTWWEEEICGDLRFVFLPASHWTSRGIWDINKTLWGSWIIEFQGLKLYFAGDTAYDQHFLEIGRKFSKIDVALMPIGPIQPRNLMREAHLCPVEAIRGFLELNAKYFIPMHWGTFKNGYESFSLPIKDLLKSWQDLDYEKQGRFLKLLKIGQTCKIE